MPLPLPYRCFASPRLASSRLASSRPGPPLLTSDESSGIVVISRGSIRREFERSLEHLDLRMPEPSATPRFDPAAYQRFLSLAQAFTPGAERTEDASTETP